MSAALAIVLTKPTASATAAAANTPDRFVATILSPSYRYDGARSVTAAKSRSRRARPRPRLRSLSHTTELTRLRPYLFVAAHESGLGTGLTKPELALCPQLARADISPLNGNSGYDPKRACAKLKSRCAQSPRHPRDVLS